MLFAVLIQNIKDLLLMCQNFDKIIIWYYLIKTVLLVLNPSSRASTNDHNLYIIKSNEGKSQSLENKIIVKIPESL